MYSEVRGFESWGHILDGHNAKPQVSLTMPNHDHFAHVSLMVLDIFLDAIAKAKILIHESIAQNLK